MKLDNIVSFIWVYIPLSQSRESLASLRDYGYVFLNLVVGDVVGFQEIKEFGGVRKGSCNICESRD